MELVITGASIVSATATVAIAFWAVFSHQLSKRVHAETEAHRKEMDDEIKRRHQELIDLYRAIVIATLETGPSAWTDMKQQIKSFNKYYPGEMKIFQDG